MRFYFRPNDIASPRNRVVFTGFTPEERIANGNLSVGHRLICNCTNIEGLAPRHWLDINGNVLQRNGRLLVDYRLFSRQSRTEVILRIRRNGFSCTEAGTYTCVVGTNTRTVLVTPFGE